MGKSKYANGCVLVSFKSSTIWLCMSTWSWGTFEVNILTDRYAIFEGTVLVNVSLRRSFSINPSKSTS